MLRVLDEADWPAVHALEELVYGSQAWSPGEVRGELTSPWSHYLGVFSAGKLVGYGGVKGDLEGDLMTVAVDAGRRRSGVATRLVAALIAWAQSRNMRTMFLEVRESNLGAQLLYEKHGFHRVGTVRGYYRDPVEDAVTMALDLRRRRAGFGELT